MLQFILKPVLGLVFNKAAEKANEVVPSYIQKVLTDEVDADKAKAIAEKIVNDKVLKSQLNLEAPHESGITIGSVGAFLAALGAEIALFYVGNFDPQLHTPNILVIVGTLYALYKRWS